MAFESIPPTEASCSVPNELRKFGQAADREHHDRLRNRTPIQGSGKLTFYEQRDIQEALYQSFLDGKGQLPLEFRLGADTIAIGAPANRRLEMISHQIAPSHSLTESTVTVTHASESTCNDSQQDSATEYSESNAGEDISPHEQLSQVDWLFDGPPRDQEAYIDAADKLANLASAKQIQPVHLITAAQQLRRLHAASLQKLHSSELVTNVAYGFSNLCSNHETPLSSLPQMFQDLQELQRDPQLTPKGRSCIAEGIYDLLARSDLTKEAYPAILEYLHELDTHKPFDAEGRSFIADSYWDILSTREAELTPETQIEVLHRLRKLQNHPEFENFPETRKQIQKDFLDTLTKLSTRIDIPDQDQKLLYAELRAIHQDPEQNLDTSLEAMKWLAATASSDSTKNDLARDIHALRIRPGITLEQQKALMSVMDQLAYHSGYAHTRIRLASLADDLLAMNDVVLSDESLIQRWSISLTLVANAPGTRDSTTLQLAKKLFELHYDQKIAQEHRADLISQISKPQPSRVLIHLIDHLHKMYECETIPLDDLIKTLSLISKQPHITYVESKVVDLLVQLARHPALSDLQRQDVLTAFFHLPCESTKWRNWETLESVASHLQSMENIACSDPELFKQWTKSLVMIANDPKCSGEMREQIANLFLEHYAESLDNQAKRLYLLQALVTPFLRTKISESSVDRFIQEIGEIRSDPQAHSLIDKESILDINVGLLRAKIPHVVAYNEELEVLADTLQEIQIHESLTPKIHANIAGAISDLALSRVGNMTDIMEAKLVNNVHHLQEQKGLYTADGHFSTSLSLSKIASFTKNPERRIALTEDLFQRMEDTSIPTFQRKMVEQTLRYLAYEHQEQE